ncbi:MAG: PD40 domain-containing protein [Actinobacteria bacterium]|nr:PD40 domain-containing protein [Actinomycetota bacterium]
MVTKWSQSLTGNAAIEADPAWSSDGRWIAVSSFEYSSGRYGSSDLIVISRDGDRERRLTTSRNETTGRRGDPHRNPNGSLPAVARLAEYVDSERSAQGRVTNFPRKSRAAGVSRRYPQSPVSQSKPALRCLVIEPTISRPLTVTMLGPPESPKQAPPFFYCITMNPGCRV